MLPGLKAELERAIASACRKQFGLDPPRVVLETPPKVELGDVASPVAFDLAKRLKRPPKKIAEEVAGALEPPPIVERVNVEGGGYLNFHLRRDELLALGKPLGRERHETGLLHRSSLGAGFATLRIRHGPFV